MIKSRRKRLVGHVARMGEKRKAHGLEIGMPEGKRPLGKLRHRWMKNIKADPGEIGYSSVDLIGLAQDRDSGNEP
jgi:hypothetical protein